MLVQKKLTARGTRDVQGLVISLRTFSRLVSSCTIVQRGLFAIEMLDMYCEYLDYIHVDTIGFDVQQNGSTIGTGTVQVQTCDDSL